MSMRTNFEKKVERMALLGSQENSIVSIGGVPTWTVVLFRRILEITGKKSINKNVSYNLKKEGYR